MNIFSVYLSLISKYALVDKREENYEFIIPFFLPAKTIFRSEKQKQRRKTPATGMQYNEIKDLMNKRMKWAERVAAQAE